MTGRRSSLGGFLRHLSAIVAGAIAAFALAPAAVLRSAPLVLRPMLGKAVATPAKPVHGRRFTFSLRVTRSDTGKPLTTGKMDCSPSVYAVR